jgi:transcriptional regulator with XRE-family HTH domain
LRTGKPESTALDWAGYTSSNPLDNFETAMTAKNRRIRDTRCRKALLATLAYYDIPQRSIAKKMGVCIQTVNSWFNGYTDPKGDDLYNLFQTMNQLKSGAGDHAKALFFGERVNGLGQRR